jgi:hypothetical protein
MRAHGNVLNDITRAVDLDGAETMWRLQKANLLAGLGRYGDAAVERKRGVGERQRRQPEVRGATVGGRRRGEEP